MYVGLRTIIMLVGFSAWSVCAADIPAANGELESGYTDMYNLRFDAAHTVFERYEQGHPQDAMGPVSDAAAYLFFEFERMHILRSDFFVQDHEFLKSKKLEPDPSVKSHFEADLARARDLEQAALQRSPTDHDALLARVLGTALHADYAALIAKQYWLALTEIKASQEEADKLLQICPDCYDANLALGVENYLLSQKSAPARWLLRLSGAQTDRETGIAKLTIVAEKGHYLKPYAKVLLAIAALRADQSQRAKQLLAELAEEFPGNTLFRDELKKLNGRNG